MNGASPPAPAPPPLPGARTAPQAVWSLVFGILSNTCLWILGSIPAIALGIGAMRKVDRSGGTLKGRGLAVAGIATGGSGLVFGFISWAVALAIILPSLAGFRGPHARVASVIQEVEMKMILVACQNYAIDHGGTLPDSLEDLHPEYIDDEETLLWPPPRSVASRGPASRPYLIRSGLTLHTTPASEPLVAAPEPIVGRRNVGFVDGRVERMDESKFQSQYAAKFAGPDGAGP